MAAAREAIAAAAADDVALTADDIARPNIGDVRADGSHFSDEFVADHQRHGNGGLRPFVPFVDVEVGAANAGHQDADQHVVDPGLRRGNVFEP